MDVRIKFKNVKVIIITERDVELVIEQPFYLVGSNVIIETSTEEELNKYKAYGDIL